MAKNFEYWKKVYESEQLEPFTKCKDALLWLKTKSIMRKEIVVEFCKFAQITLKESSLVKTFKEIYDLLSIDFEKSHELLDEFIIRKNKQILFELNQKQIVSELYKVKNFEWGGDYQNSLEKYLISNYVKVISSFDLLVSKFDTEISRTVQGYVINSWYNHWSSILIEHIFKSHTIVLPTVGKIRSVDFFVNQIPFDLKVTYFPAEYLKQIRKEKGFPVELTFLKKSARDLGIDFDKKAKGYEIHYEITEKLKDRNSPETLAILNEVKKQNMQIVKETIANPRPLITWLYENQGEMRFDTENRLFLVLLDSENFGDSWKLKRNIDLLKPEINSYLDRFEKKNVDDLKIEFTYSGKSQKYVTYADVIFIVR